MCFIMPVEIDDLVRARARGNEDQTAAATLAPIEPVLPNQQVRDCPWTAKDAFAGVNFLVLRFANSIARQDPEVK